MSSIISVLFRLSGHTYKVSRRVSLVIDGGVCVDVNHFSDNNALWPAI